MASPPLSTPTRPHPRSGRLARLAPLMRTLRQSKFVRDMAILQLAKFGVAGIGAASTFILVHFLTPSAYGMYGLATGTLAIWQSFDLTGASTHVGTRLAVAAGANDGGEVLRLMAFYVRISLLVAGLVALTLLLFAPLYTAAAFNDAAIGQWAAWLGVAAIADTLYGLILMSLSSRRQMQHLGTLQVVNQGMYSLALVGAAAVNAHPASLIAGRVIYSFSTLIFAFWLYRRARRDPAIQPPHPSLGMVFSQALRAPLRESAATLRFGIANAADKTLSAWFVQIPLQLVGAVGGTSAAGFLTLAVNGIGRTGMLTGALFENMQAVVPRAVGRGEYARLWRNFLRVLLVLAVGGAVVFGLFALLIPLVMPIFSDQWQGAIPALVILSLYGLITTVGGVFGPLYRALNRVRYAVLVKLIALALVLPAGAMLLNTGVARTPLAGFTHIGGDTVLVKMTELAGSANAAAAGAWIIVGLFTLSVVGTGLFALPALRKRAREQR